MPKPNYQTLREEKERILAWVEKCDDGAYAQELAALGARVEEIDFLLALEHLDKA